MYIYTQSLSGVWCCQITEFCYCSIASLAVTPVTPSAPCRASALLRYSPLRSTSLLTLSTANDSRWWRASRFLPSWRIWESGLRWRLRTAFPPHSCSRRCCSCSRSTLNIFPPRSQSLLHILWLVSPPFCSRQPSRSFHPGDVDPVSGELRRRLMLLAFCRRRLRFRLWWNN